jgi:predicted metal-dependent enzyme (double-stranded beta helix superfamily)
MTALLNASPSPSPVALTPLELVEYTRFITAEVVAGSYPFIDYNAEQRWHQRIYRDARVDVWLISWLPTQGTQLHDHGGSSGAFTVVWGELSEATYVPSTGGLSERRHGAGKSIGFDGRYVHDVRNTSDAPAVSVHAYSHPLTSMNYFDVNDGELVHLARLATDDPEAEYGRH